MSTYEELNHPLYEGLLPNVIYSILDKSPRVSGYDVRYGETLFSGGRVKTIEVAPRDAGPRQAIAMFLDLPEEVKRKFVDASAFGWQEVKAIDDVSCTIEAGGATLQIYRDCNDQICSVDLLGVDPD